MQLQLHPVPGYWAPPIASAGPSWCHMTGGSRNPELVLVLDDEGGACCRGIAGGGGWCDSGGLGDCPLM